MRRGFTLVELSVVMAVAAIVIPAGWMLVRSQESAHHSALARASAAREMRSISEEIRRDLRSMQPAQGDGLVLRGACGSVTYTLDDGTLVRSGDEACGARRPVATHVAAIERQGNTVTIAFEHRVGRPQPERASFTLALPVAAPAVVGEVTP